MAPEQPVRVAEIRDEWVKVEVLNNSACTAADNGPPEVIATGWLPLHDANGEPSISVFVARMLTIDGEAGARGGRIHRQVGMGLRGLDRRYALEARVCSIAGGSRSAIRAFLDAKQQPYHAGFGSGPRGR